MDLTDMSRDELGAVINRLVVVQAAADVLADGGLEPVVDMDDWATVLRCRPLRESDVAGSAPVVCDGTVPDVTPITVPSDPPGGAFDCVFRDDFAADCPMAEADDPIEADPGPVLIEDEDTGDAPAVTDSDPAPVPAAQELPVGVGTVPAVEAPDLPAARTTPGGGQAGGAVAAVYGAAWTAAEDDALVAGVVALMQAGKSRAAAGAEMADRLGRPVEGAKYRMNKVLKPRIDAALAASEADDDQVKAKAAPPAPHSLPVAGDGIVLHRTIEPVAPPVVPKPRAVRPAMPPEYTGDHRRIWAWLDDLGNTADFTPGDDLAMVEAFARGIRAAQLALDMDVDAKALIDRYKAVTEPIRNGKGHIQPDLQHKLADVLRRRRDDFAAAKAVA